MDDLTALAVAARDGNRMALGAFIRAAQPEVWRFCAHLAGVHEADDLVQDVFVAAHRSLPSFRAEASARTWLFTIARRRVADRARSARRRRALYERLVAQRPVTTSGGPDVAWTLVDALGEPLRTAFVLTQASGLSYEEAARVCACPVGTIRSRVARARERLIAQLADHEVAADEAEA